MKRRVNLYIDDPLIPVKEPRIDPRFMSVDHLPGDRFRFRFELDKKGHDDSTGRDFDWWFEALTGSSEKGGKRQGDRGHI